MIKTALAFIKKDFLLASSYKASFIIQFITIFFGVSVFYYIGEVFGGSASSFLAVSNNNYFSYLLLGFAFLDYHVVSLSAFSTSIQESQMMGTLEIILLSPVRVSTMILCSSLWGYMFTSIRFLVYLLFGTLIFGLNIGNANVLGALVILILSIACFAGFGIILAGIVVVFKKSDSINAIVGAASTFLGGVLYPVEVLPDWISRFSNFIPLTHALKGIRQAMLQGYSLSQLWPEIMFLFLFSVIFRYCFWAAPQQQ